MASSLLFFLRFIFGFHLAQTAMFEDISSDLLKLDEFDASVIVQEEKMVNLRLDLLPEAVKVFTPAGAASAFPEAVCLPINPDVIFDHLQIKPRFFLIWVEDDENLQVVLEALEKTVLNCPDRIEPGYLAAANGFVFFVDDSDSAGITAGDVFRSGPASKEMRRHRRVAVFKQIKDETAVAVRYNIYRDEVTQIGLWTKEGDSKFQLDKLFDNFPMDDFLFTMTGNPYDVYLDADVKTEIEDPRRAYDNHTAYEIEVLRQICMKLDCRVEYTNPASQIWGTVKNGNATGLYRDVALELAHFAMGAVYGDIKKAMVTDFTVEVYLRDADGLVFAVKNPGEKTSLFKFLSPFRPLVRLLLLCSMLVMAIATFIVANLEEGLVGRKGWLMTWSTWSGSAWFIFGTGIGESITRSTRSGGAWGLRFVITSWFLSALIASTAYGGNLRAFLMTPEKEKPIDDLAGLTQSGLTWNMVLYGETVERDMERSQDPVIRQIWDEKEVVEYQLFPFERLTRAYEGDFAMIEWSALLETTMAAGFTLPNGENLVHVPKTLGLHPPVYSIWAFHPLNPWIHRFNYLLTGFTESGLIFHWRRLARLELNAKFKGQVETMNVETPVDKLIKQHKEALEALSTTDFAGSLMCFGVALAFSILVFFAAELPWSRRKAQLDQGKFMFQKSGGHYLAPPSVPRPGLIN